MKIAVVGTGSITESIHLPILQTLPDLEIVAICDSNQKQLTRVSDKFKIEKRYTDVEDMLKETEIDILDVCTPGFTHFEIVKKALSHDIHTLVEKPATLSSAEVEYLASESHKKNLQVGVCQTLRYKEPVLEFQRIRERGGIGTIERMVSMQRGSTVFALAPWFWNENVSGGILFELGIHLIDLQCYLMGRPKKVLSIHAQYDENLKFTTSFLATVEYNTGVGIIDLKWFSSSNFIHQYVSGSVADAIMKFIPDGFALQQSDFSPLAEFLGEARRMWNFGYAALRKRYSQKSQSAHRIVIENFLQSVKTGKQPLVPISGVLDTIGLVEQIRAKAGMPALSSMNEQQA